jgi:hypothetical protein
MALELHPADDRGEAHPRRCGPDSPRRSAPMQKLYSLLERNDGQTMTEYATTL